MPTLFFAESAALGVSFALLAGGKPMIRRDVIEAASRVKNVLFPVFTNGTLIGSTYIDFIKHHLNIIPIISIEGTSMRTDQRRGRCTNGGAD